jgi:hypothetical protein
MADKNLRIKVSAKGARKASQQLGGVDSKLKGLAKSAGLAAAGFFGARALLSGFKEAIRLAGIQEQAEKRLSVALGGNTKALLDQATALQKVTTFGDEAIIGVQASIAAFVDNEDQIKKATEATLDMAVAMGMDLKGAGDLIAKTLGSSTNALSRYGIQVEGAVGSTERLESLTANVAKLFGGQAKAQAETMAGSIDQMKNASGDAAEAVGELLSPAIINISKSFTGAASAVAVYIRNLALSRKAIEDVATSQEKEEILLAKIGIKRNELNELDKSGFTFLLQKKNLEEEISSLEIDLDNVRLGNIFEFNEAGQKHLDNLDKEIKKKQDLQVIEKSKSLFIRDGINLTAKAIKLKDLEVLKEGTVAEILKKSADARTESFNQQLKQAALVQGSAEDAMKAIIRAESMEAVAGYISGLFQSFHPLVALVLSAGAGAVVSKAIDRGLASFAEGGDFVTSGPKMMMVGDNPGGRERVQVTPLSSPNVNGPQGGITINVSAPLVDETVIDSIIPAIQKAQRFDLA